MFSVTRNGPNRIDIEFSGKLDSNEMKTALDELLNYFIYFTAYPHNRLYSQFIKESCGAHTHSTGNNLLSAFLRQPPR